ncbi:hypothetical protein FNV43_RR18830 [Rhamnella rubrinervis]|uniref:Uncharacterized protein n=1 Tax=Rhamnella rubrinervis TaxID=2594499 RepID=A0A8K0GWF4_9ROSA|nr:hypothetical protein FNV43_RR18830 [Rhamnella rubrinervis]
MVVEVEERKMEAENAFNLSEPITVGDYILKSKIGQGSFSTVWKAEHRFNGQQVAVKQFKGSLGFVDLMLVWFSKYRDLFMMDGDIYGELSEVALRIKERHKKKNYKAKLRNIKCSGACCSEFSVSVRVVICGHNTACLISGSRQGCHANLGVFHHGLRESSNEVSSFLDCRLSNPFGSSPFDNVARNLIWSREAFLFLHKEFVLSKPGTPTDVPVSSSVGSIVRIGKLHRLLLEQQSFRKGLDGTYEAPVLSCFRFAGLRRPLRRVLFFGSAQTASKSSVDAAIMLVCRFPGLVLSKSRSHSVGSSSSSWHSPASFYGKEACKAFKAIL